MELSRRAWIDLVLLALLWGGSFLAIRVALDEVRPFQVVAARVALAALTLWALILVSGAARPELSRWRAFLGMGALNNLVPFGLIAWGQQHVETGLAAILNAATAVWGVLVAALLLADERLTGRRLLGVLLGFGGVATIVGPGALAGLDPRAMGQLAVIGATICYALAGVWGRRYLAGVRPLAAAAGMLTASSLLAIPLALLVDGLPPWPLRPATLAGLGYISVLATGVAYLLYWRILAAAGSGNAMLVTLLVAPVAVLLGAAVRSEALSGLAYLGFALLACGLLVLSPVGAREKPLAKAAPPG